MIARSWIRAAAPGYQCRRALLSRAARGRAFLYGLSRPSGTAGIADALRTRRNFRCIRRGRTETQLLNGPHTAPDAERARREMDGLLTELQELDAEIRARSPRYAELTRPRPLDAAAVQAQVLDDDTLLLEYALGAERSFLWVLTRTSLESYSLPPRAEVERAARAFYGLLTARNEDRPGEDPCSRRRA